MEKYTKKATAKIFAEVLKVDPKASKLTSLDQAYVILMSHWDMELSIYKPLHELTKVALFRDDLIVKEWKFENGWDDKEGDFDWNTIYKDKTKLCYYLFGLYPKSSEHEIVTILSEWNCNLNSTVVEYSIKDVYDIAKKIIKAASIQPMYDYLLKEQF